MLFLAEFINADVRDSADQKVGRLIDLIATASESEKYPPITALLVKTRGGDEKLVAFSYVANMGRDEIVLKTLEKNITIRDSAPTDIFLYRDILDKQIVDLEGTRMVRVNDLQFGIIEGKTRVIGIDISTRGILRRLGIDRWKIFRLARAKFINWDKVQILGSSLKLSTVSNELVKLHPADLANIIEDMNVAQSKTLMTSLDPDTAAKVFEELDEDFRHYILKMFDAKKASFVLAKLPIDELVDYFKSIPKKDMKKLLSTLDDKKKKEVLKFIQYEDDTAGGLMTTEFVKGDPGWTVQETLDKIRRVSDQFRSINFIYILSDSGELVGVVSLRALIISDPKERLRKIMKKIKPTQTVHVDADIEEIGQVMVKYSIPTVAVTDDQQKFLGIITADDILDEFVSVEE
ncbi:MAG: CBS domain-containing protein [Candidatus Peregrinibacteria bacterium]|nr:CBS domain-containing protein [Candidatus Peregrinibacteria bacterium]